MKDYSRIWGGFVGTMLTLGQAAWSQSVTTLPSDFIALRDVAPSIVQEMRYAGNHNFLGRPVAGYQAAECLLTRPAAEALGRVQEALHPFGLSLKVYDCYRPQRAVDDFVRWGKDLNDTAMKAEFYPRVSKAAVFERGYVAERSGHSRGSTVDLTLIPLPVPEQEAYQPGDPLKDCALQQAERFGDNSLEMGTGYDCFDPLAHTLAPGASATARAHRALLVTLMNRDGFDNLPQEWWHYTLRQEPYPDTYWDAPVTKLSTQD
jgi:D-alanyl-D-alanine dipeptidase